MIVYLVSKAIERSVDYEKVPEKVFTTYESAHKFIRAEREKLGEYDSTYFTCVAMELEK